MCERSQRQWCAICGKEFLAGFYLFEDAKNVQTVRQWHLCNDCGSNPPRLWPYEHLAAQLVTKALL